MLKGLNKKRVKKIMGCSLTEIFDLPHEVVMNLPKITIIGNLILEIENHRGIIEYCPEKIRVGVTGGELEVRGENLILSNILPDFINIRGTIKDIELLW